MITQPTEVSAPPAARRPIPSWLLTFFLSLNAGLLLLVGWVYLRFDSVENALAFAAGRTLSVQNATQAVGAVVPGSNYTYAFTITNPEATPVRVVGAATSCVCSTAAQPIPFVIPGGGRFVFRATLRTPPQLGPFRLPITLFTNHPSQRRLELVVTGQIVAEPAPTQPKSS